MKVLLVYPNIYGMNMLPSAIGLFTAILKQHGHIVDLFDSTNWKIPDEVFDSDKEKEFILTARPFDDSKLRCNIRTSNVFEDFRVKVKEFAPDLLCISVNEDLYPIAVHLLAELGDALIPTIMGGVFATFAPERCLSLPQVNMVCIGEGEKVLVDVCDRLENGGAGLENIPGLWVKTASGIVRNPIGPPVDFNNNPVVDFSLFDESRFYRPMQGKVWRMFPVETHRGCPYMCAYCNSPAQQRMYRTETGRNFYRKKNFDAVHKELSYYKNELKAEAFYFWADSFLAYTDREMEMFCELYQDIGLPFWCQSRPETLNEKGIKQLMDIGLFRMGFGVEHGNEEFRKTVLKRNVSNKVMIDNFAMLNKLGLMFSVNNIIGFPRETRELAMDTIELNRQIKADSANIYSFSPFHGTPLRELAEELGYCDKNLIARSVTRPTMLNMPHFPPDAIEGLRRCFTLYVRMPKERWPEIGKAEKMTSEGHRIWEELRHECLDKYINFD